MEISDAAKLIAAKARGEQPEPEPSTLALARARQQTGAAIERSKAREQAKQEAARAREQSEIWAAFKASGCASIVEFLAKQEAEIEAAERAEAERDRRMREYAGVQRDLADGRPDVRDLALELSRRHEGGRVTWLTVLMVEAGLAADADEAAWRVKGREGQALAAALDALGWTRTNRSGRKGWRPPRGG